MRYLKYVLAPGLLACLIGLAQAGEPSCCPPPQDCWFARLAPVGGCSPYGGGLLRWWDPHAFPRGGMPDDYDRKPLPPTSWCPSTSAPCLIPSETITGWTDCARQGLAVHGP